MFVPAADFLSWRCRFKLQTGQVLTPPRCLASLPGPALRQKLNCRCGCLFPFLFVCVRLFVTFVVRLCLFLFFTAFFFLTSFFAYFFSRRFFMLFGSLVFFYLFFMCVDGGGNVRRHGDRAHAGRQGPNPRTEAHPSPAEGTPGALLGRPLHRTVRGKRPAETPLLYTTPSWVFVLNHSTYEGLGMHQQNNQNSRLTPTYQ